jgi:hypothetical protein
MASKRAVSEVLTEEREDMSKAALLTGLALLILGVTEPLWGQNISKPTAKVTDVRAVHSVSIKIRVFSGDKDVFVPYCGQSEGGTEFLCGPPAPTHLEVQTANGWRPVRLRTNDAVLGRLSPERWDIRPIPAGGWHDFLFGLSKDDLAIEGGQRLRLVVDAWPDEQSVRSGGRPIQLATPPFECP